MPKEYSFLQEEIKDQGPRGKIKSISVVRILCAGLLFGIAACIGFSVCKPWIDSMLWGKTEQIEIPKDEEVQSPKITEDQEEEQWSVENYKEAEKILRGIATEAEKSVVDISGITGVIVANNGQELLVLTTDQVLKQKQIAVTFFDGEKYEGTIKQYTKNLNLAMVSVKKHSLKDTTLGKMQIAKIGNSNRVQKGDTLIALGSPFGYEKSLGYGIASSVSQQIRKADGSYNLITTDMTGTSTSSGVLFDIEGYVVGFATPDTVKTTKEMVLAGYGISDIKKEIELLSNGNEVPYIGIVGMLVTEKIAKEKKMPQGLYVTEVEKDSPAMKAGIQAGDVITAVSGNEISSLSGYREMVLSEAVGEEVQLKGQGVGTEDYVELKFQVMIGIKK